MSDEEAGSAVSGCPLDDFLGRVYSLGQIAEQIIRSLTVKNEDSWCETWCDVVEQHDEWHAFNREGQSVLDAVERLLWQADCSASSNS